MLSVGGNIYIHETLEWLIWPADSCHMYLCGHIVKSFKTLLSHAFEDTETITEPNSKQTSLLKQRFTSFFGFLLLSPSSVGHKLNNGQEQIRPLQSPPSSSNN
jgi:hypothetical protein